MICEPTGATIFGGQEGEMKRSVVGALLLFALSGCAVNGYAKYYTPNSRSEAAQKNSLFERFSGEPKIYTYSEWALRWSWFILSIRIPFQV